MEGVGAVQAAYHHARDTHAGEGMVVCVVWEECGVGRGRRVGGHNMHDGERAEWEQAGGAGAG